MIENKKLKDNEKEWLEKMLTVALPFYTDIINQINHAEVSREYTEYYLRLKFNVRESEKVLPISTRVPIEMRVFLKNRAPMQFLLHVINGCVSELEAFMADSSKISTNIDLKYETVKVLAYFEQ